MAKTFYYDSNDILNATLNDGTFSAPSFVDGTPLTNEERAIDQSIASAITSFDTNDILRFDYGSAVTNDFAALYLTGSTETNVAILDSDNGTTCGGNTTISDTIPAGWTVTSLTSESHRYWLVHATNGALTGLTEVILGQKLEFEINPDIGIGEQEIYGTDVQRSIGGTEYAVKKHNPISTISMNFSNISSTFKTKLQSMEAAVTDYKKFIYSEDGTTGSFHYVRLEAPMDFTEVAYQRYSTNIKLREQLA